MPNPRPFRAHETYAAACLECGEEIEVPALPVPQLCVVCQARKNSEAKAAGA